MQQNDAKSDAAANLSSKFAANAGEPLAADKKANRSALKLRRLWLLIGWLLVLMVTTLSLIPPTQYDAIVFDINDKIGHLVGYGILMGWFGCLSMGQRLLKPAVFFLVMGTALEFAQMSAVYRMFDSWDLVANYTGVLIALLCMFTPLRFILLRFDQLVTGGLRRR